MLVMNNQFLPKKQYPTKNLLTSRNLSEATQIAHYHLQAQFEVWHVKSSCKIQIGFHNIFPTLLH